MTPWDTLRRRIPQWTLYSHYILCVWSSSLYKCRHGDVRCDFREKKRYYNTHCGRWNTRYQIDRQQSAFSEYLSFDLFGFFFTRRSTLTFCSTCLGLFGVGSYMRKKKNCNYHLPPVVIDSCTVCGLTARQIYCRCILELINERRVVVYYSLYYLLRKF